MINDKQKRRFNRLGALAVAAAGLVAVALPLAPAKAQIGFGCGPFGCGVGVGPFAVGVGTPYYSPYYGYPYPSYYAPYSRAYWWGGY
jgi:hypothetical protein